MRSPAGKLSRRRFLQASAMAVAGTSLATFMQGCSAVPAPAGSAPAVSGPALRMWWWGEQEAPGLEGWVKESIDLFKAQSGNTVESTLQDTDVVISGFQTASAANDAPDIQFLWNGIWHMESVWLGYLEPLDDLLPADLLKNSGATSLSVFEGKQYRLGWYGLPMPWVYNKEMFDKVGLNADAPPTTWDEFMDACDKLKSGGFDPIAVGLKDGFWGEWYMGHALGQNLDSPADAINLFIGDLDWREPKYHEHWSKLKELWDAGFINNDVNSIDLYPGIELYGAGQGAMTAIVGPLIPAMADKLGAEKIGLMVFPVFGTGQMAGKPIFDSQGLGISSQSQNKAGAAQFLEFLHTTERLDALWNEVHTLPSDSGWDSSVVEDALTKQQITDFVTADHVAYISNLMPVLFWNDAMFVNSQKIVGGEWGGEEAGENGWQVANKWREQNPDLVEKYTTWAKDLGI